MRHRHLVLGLLALASFVVSIILGTYGAQTMASVAGRLGTGFLGSFLTVLLIDRKLDREELRKAGRIREAALIRLRPALLRHLELLGDWYKAAATAPPSQEPSTIEAIFAADYYEQVRLVDFASPGPTVYHRRWLEYSALRLDDLRNELNRTLDRYAAVLDPDTIERLEVVAQSHIVSFVTDLARPETQDAMRKLGSPTASTILAHDSVIGYLKGHVETFLALLSLFNAHVSNTIDIDDFTVWDQDRSPGFGNARSEMGAPLWTQSDSDSPP